MQQNCRPLIIVNSDFEEIRIERDDLEWEVGGGVCIMMANLKIPPIVRRTITDESSKHERLFGKPIRLKDRHGALNCLTLVIAEPVGG